MESSLKALDGRLQFIRKRVKGACPTVVNVKNSRTHTVCKGEEGKFSVKYQKRVEGCSVSILHGCSTHQGSCCKAKNGEIGGSEEPKSTKIVDSGG